MDKFLQPGKVCLEILVHTSAPVTNADDDMYRKQARALSAYLNERAQTVNRIDRMTEGSTLIQQTPLPDKPSKESQANDNLGCFHKGDFAIAESILISTSSKDSTSSAAVGLPPLYHKQTPLAYNQNPKSPTSSTASVLGDPVVFRNISSIPSKDIANSHQTAKKRSSQSQDTDSLICTTFSTASIGISPDSAGFVLHSPTYIRDRKRKVSEAAEKPRRAQDNMVLSECSPNTGRKRQRLMTVAEKDSSTNIHDKHVSQVEPGHWVGSIARFSSSITGPSTQPSLPTTALPESTAPCRTYLPPWPETREEQYKTHKVGVFAYIASNTMLCSAYKPKSTKRLIEPLERGYWRLKIPFSWSTKAQDDFWSLLEDMIVQGKCGWGNWIEHVDGSSTENVGLKTTKEKNVNLSQGSIADIKVWCWGEVVREMWLAILMASRRQTMRLGMAWHDSCGNVVVQMR